MTEDWFEIQAKGHEAWRVKPTKEKSVSEPKKKIDKLLKEIENLLRVFTEETGLVVEDIDIRSYTDLKTGRVVGYKVS